MAIILVMALVIQFIIKKLRVSKHVQRCSVRSTSLLIFVQCAHAKRWHKSRQLCRKKHVLDCQPLNVTEHTQHWSANTKTDLRVPLLQTTCGQKCFSFRGAKLWNGLDAKPKLSKNLKQFKSCLENSRTKGTYFINAID